MHAYRIYEDCSVYFITCSVLHWFPIFVNEATNKIITDSLMYCAVEKGLRTNAYVIMPTHLHAIIFDKDHDSGRLAESWNAFRKYTGRALLDYAAKHLPPMFSEAFRDAAASDRTRRFWQPRQHPTAIASEGFWRQKLDYLHDNPCRKGLVLYPEDWRFSSARYYLEGKNDLVDLEITQIEW